MEACLSVREPRSISLLTAHVFGRQVHSKWVSFQPTEKGAYSNDFPTLGFDVHPFVITL